MTGLLIAVAAGVVVAGLVWAFCLAAASADERTCPLQDWDAAFVRELADVHP